MSNNQSIKISRQVFDKDKFNETVDTSFTQLVPVVDPLFFDINLATQEDFFILYNKFFYTIPKGEQGEVNTHLYLVETSGEYINYAPNELEIQALLEEIAELRIENLEVRQEIADVITQFTTVQNNV
jgi:NTP pyrophosphatase (non-canonical NTP hydrolase)